MTQLTYAAPLPAVDSLDAVAGDDGHITVTARKLIAGEDPYLGAHFPGRPVYPGVFILETVRQAVVSAAGAGPGPVPDVSALTSLRFFHPLAPGDRLRAEVAIAPPDSRGERKVTASCLRGDGIEAARMSLMFGTGFTAPGALAGNGSGPVPARTGTLGYERIRAILPHGPQMVLVDRAEVARDGRTLRAVKAVSGTEPCYQHLTAGLPRERFAYPVSLIIESFGQAAAVLWRAGADPLGGRLLMFAAARNWRFEGHVYPGDVLRHVVSIESSIASTAFASGQIWAGGRRVATAGSVIAVVRPAGGGALDLPVAARSSPSSPEPVTTHVLPGSWLI